MNESVLGGRLRTFSRRNIDLLLVLAATLITIPTVLCVQGSFRAILAIPFVIFSPGYSLIAALYPRHDSIGSVERIALGFGASIVIVPLFALVLNHTPLGVRLLPALVTLSGFVVIACLVASIRRCLYRKEQHSVRNGPSPTSLRRFEQPGTILTGCLIAAIVFAVGVLVYIVATPKDGEQFTEFYILGPHGTAEDYPYLLNVGEPTHLIIGVVNHEGEPVAYTIQARLDGDSSAVALEADGQFATQSGRHSLVIGPLDDREKTEFPVRVTALAAGERLRLEFLLFSPRLREGNYLRGSLANDGCVSIEPYESRGWASVTLHAGDETVHSCRVEAWQQGHMVAHAEVSVQEEETRRFTLHYPAGQTTFRVYDGDTVVLEDAGNDLSLHLWVNVSGA